MKVTGKQLIKQLSECTGLTQKAIDGLLDELGILIITNAKEGNPVVLPRVGIIKPKFCEKVSRSNTLLGKYVVPAHTRLSIRVCADTKEFLKK